MNSQSIRSRRRLNMGVVGSHALMLLLCVIFVVPLVMIFSVSVTEQNELTRRGFQLIPEHISWTAYGYVFKNPTSILNAYQVTIITSVVSTFLYLLMSGMCAYALSRKDFAWRRIVTFYLFFTMLFSGGLVSYYIICTQYLRLGNSLWTLIVTQLGNVWNLFLMRTYFQDLPDGIIESATIDGANDWQTFIRIVVPLSTPSLATIGLLQFLGYWNSWFNALLFITDKTLVPLQYLLQSMLRNVIELKRNMQGMGANYVRLEELPTEPLQMAMCLLAIGPVILIFPFFQKYFTKGLTVGSIKG